MSVDDLVLKARREAKHAATDFGAVILIWAFAYYIKYKGLPVEAYVTDLLGLSVLVKGGYHGLKWVEYSDQLDDD
ncbi:hypothetical protein KY330_05860 [Candidatus Woesearchaeota archaeon]|nr:hypothetical protein [Candidatus Woesearchaeota archaeon]